MTKTETRRMVTAAATACEEKKAERILILELDPADSGFTDYFLICSGTNTRQNQAIASGIEDAMKRDFSTYANSVEGYRQGEWILLDYVDFVVHIFSEEKRDFYDIERLRKTATSLGVGELKASLVQRTTAARKKQPVKKAASKKTAVRKPAARKPAAKKSLTKKAAIKKPAIKSAKKSAAKSKLAARTTRAIKPKATKKQPSSPRKSAAKKSKKK